MLSCAPETGPPWCTSVSRPPLRLGPRRILGGPGKAGPLTRVCKRLDPTLPRCPRVLPVQLPAVRGRNRVRRSPSSSLEPLCGAVCACTSAPGARSGMYTGTHQRKPLPRYHCCSLQFHAAPRGATTSVCYWSWTIKTTGETSYGTPSSISLG